MKKNKGTKRKSERVMTMTSNDIMLRKKKKGKCKARFIENGHENYLFRQFDVIDMSYASKTFF